MTDFLAETQDLLGRTPVVLRALLANLPHSWGDTPDTEGGWRPRDVVGHLISAELDNYLGRAQHILQHGTAVPFEPFDRFAHVERDADATLDELIDRFERLRNDNLAELARTVSEADLDRRGMHPALGEVTLRQLLSTWAVHDLDHTAQVFAAMAGSHHAEVGPWKVNLGILLRRDDPGAFAG
jgi:uncharacterized damage-inducible protein DinB